MLAGLFPWEGKSSPAATMRLPGLGVRDGHIPRELTWTWREEPPDPCAGTGGMCTGLQDREARRGMGWDGKGGEEMK